MEELDGLISTFEKEYMGATEEFLKSRFKNALILYSKSMFALCDIIILKEFGKLPKNHSERFRILKNNFQEIYQIVDEIWSDYRDSYSKLARKENTEKINNAIRKISGFPGIPKRIIEIIEKT